MDVETSCSTTRLRDPIDTCSGLVAGGRAHTLHSLGTRVGAVPEQQEHVGSTGLAGPRGVPTSLRSLGMVLAGPERWLSAVGFSQRPKSWRVLGSWAQGSKGQGKRD